MRSALGMTCVVEQWKGDGVVSVSERKAVTPACLSRRANRARVTAYLLYNGSATYVQ